MRSFVRFVACALVAVFLGTPVWVAACDINCEAASHAAAPAAPPDAATRANVRTATASAETARHHHQHDHQHQMTPSATSTTGAAAATPHSPLRIAAIADACDSAGLLVSAGTAPSATRVWNVQLAPAPVVSAFALACVESAAPSDARCALPRPDRPLATVLRI